MGYGVRRNVFNLEFYLISFRQFVIEDNPADLVALKLGAGSHSPLSNQATKIMNTLQLSGARHIIQRGGATPDALKAHVRILTADEDDLAEIQQRLVEYKQKNVNLNDLTFLESSDNELNVSFTDDPRFVVD